MFLSRSDTPNLDEADLHGMCVSLNCPVLNIEALPVGPARALIALHRDERSGTALTVAIRSLETGRVALFTYQGELRKADSPTLVMDGALSFAEGMGFLFDEDLIEFGGPGGRQRALRHWLELVGGVVFEPEPVPEPDCAPAGGSAPPSQEGPDRAPLAELVLDRELPEPGLNAPPSCPASELGTGVEGAGPQQGLPLTKFRQPSRPATDSAKADDPVSSGKETAGSSRLGRVAIVKMRKGGDGQPKPGLLIRLLGRF